MPVFYLDTSAIVKRYRREKGTEIIDQLLVDPGEADRFYTSFLSVLELTSAITRLSKAGELSKSVASELLARFHEDTEQQFRIWPVDDEIIGSAISMSKEHALRSADAIHLATAVTISSLLPGANTALVSSDRELIKAAEARHLVTIDPLEKNASGRLSEFRRAPR